MFGASKVNVPGIIVFGCGPHYTTRYHRVIEDHVRTGLCTLDLIVDLSSKEEQVKKFLSERNIRPKHMFFLGEESRHFLDPVSFQAALDAKDIKLAPRTYSIISTEPKSHFSQALWCLSQGYDVFCDKPVTAPLSLDGKERFADQLTKLEEALGASQRYWISCERRGNPGYMLFFERLGAIMRQFDVPVTGINIEFAGGVWNTFNEYNMRENHPYKYGYGVTLHSGYHYFDLLSELLQLNIRQLGFAESVTDFSVVRRSPHEVAPFIPRLNGGQNVLETIQNTLGETDAYIMGSTIFENGLKTLFSLSLTDISASKRNTAQVMNNPYIEGGRIRFESVTVHLGHICTAKIKCDSLPSADEMPENFEIEFVSNHNRGGGVEVETLRHSDVCEIMQTPNNAIFNIHSRLQQLSDFIVGGETNSTLGSHKRTATLLDQFFFDA